MIELGIYGTFKTIYGVGLLVTGYFCTIGQKEKSPEIKEQSAIRVQAAAQKQLNESKRLDFVEVYVWLGRSVEGLSTTASSGGKESSQYNAARCGHVALGIFQNNKEVAYASFWPPRKLVEDLFIDEISEGSKPDAILRLHHLDIPAMLEELAIAQQRIEKGTLAWTWNASDRFDIQNPQHTTTNCASLAYALLKVGGLGNATSPYSRFVRGRGPRNKLFYECMKCNMGDRWGGIFNGAPWTGRWFSPKALLLRTAAAAEAFHDDVVKTSQIMMTDRVTSRPYAEK
jgi:hypothetical protein